MVVGKQEQGRSRGESMRGERTKTENTAVEGATEARPAPQGATLPGGGMKRPRSDERQPSMFKSYHLSKDSLVQSIPPPRPTLRHRIRTRETPADTQQTPLRCPIALFCMCGGEGSSLCPVFIKTPPRRAPLWLRPAGFRH